MLIKTWDKAIEKLKKVQQNEAFDKIQKLNAVRDAKKKLNNFLTSNEAKIGMELLRLVNETIHIASSMSQQEEYYHFTSNGFQDGYLGAFPEDIVDFINNASNASNASAISCDITTIVEYIEEKLDEIAKDILLVK